jgi:hypothetical protein
MSNTSIINEQLTNAIKEELLPIQISNSFSGPNSSSLPSHIFTVLLTKNIPIARSKHDLHVQECDRRQFRVQQIFPEDLVEMRSDEDLGAFCASGKKSLDYTAQ